MSLLLYRNIKITRNQIVIIAFLFYLILLYSLLAFLVITGRDYVDYLLRDDGYYSIAGNFANGNFNSGSVIGPGLPLIFAPIYFFSENMHPFLRLFISETAVLIILFTVSKLTIKYLNNKHLFWGLLMVVIHPVFIQWTFRTSVDLYLSLFLGVFILFLIKFIDKGRIIDLLISFLAYLYAIFTRPSFIFIPIILLLASLIILKNKKIILISLTLFFISVVGFYANNMYLQNNIGSKKITADSGRSIAVIYNFVITKTILETGQFHKGTIDNYNIREQSQDGNRVQKGIDYIDLKASEFIEDYKAKYPDKNFIHMILYYIREHPLIAVAKILLGPVFFFALSSREIVSYLLLLFSIVYFVLVWKSLKPLLADKGNKQYFVILFSILFGYFLLHWATHAYSRYSLVILPFLFVWTGPQIVRILGKSRLMLKKTN